MKKLTQDDFIAKANSVHGNLYDYSKSRYVNARTKLTIRCPKHGAFIQRPADHLNSKQGCPKCGRQRTALSQTRTQDDFLLDAVELHGDAYDYSLVAYEDYSTHVLIICPKHGEFRQSPIEHLRGRGCRKCANEVHSKYMTKSTTDFVKSAKKIHGRKYTYNSEYVNVFTPIPIVCPKHGVFMQRPSNHLQGSGCPQCAKRAYSKVAIRWIEQESKSRRLKGMLHAENGGEYCIPGTHLKVDGFHPRTNTVFEFHGDAYHGNPLIFNPHSRPHPFNNKTAKRLYKETCERTEYLRSLGYRVIEMWENDFV